MLKKFFKNRFNKWMAIHNPPSSERVRLFNRRLYILPTRFGVMYSFLLLVVFLAAINYQNSMSFALSFLLTAIGIISLWQTHRNMLNLEIDLIKPDSVLCSEKIDLTFIVYNPHTIYHYSIGIQYQQAPPVYFSLEPNSKQQISLSLNTQQRGEFKLDGVTFFTRFPTGLFHCWSWLQFKQTLTVYPKPINASLETYSTETSEDGLSKLNISDGDDFAGLREYKQGESLKHISWKAYAQGKGKLTKTYRGYAQPSLWFDWDLIKGTSVEEKISKLTSLILKAHQTNQRYGLKAPHIKINKADGSSHKHQCLHALACINQKHVGTFNAKV